MTHHPARIGAPRHLMPDAAPYLLDRDDSDFVNAVLAELPAENGAERLRSTRASGRDRLNRLKLYQPVQRRFHVALIEAWCDVPGTPRLDPAKVEAAGLVVRRVAPDGRMEGWMKGAGVLRGWLPVDRVGGDSADPHPEGRLAGRATGVASIDTALRRLEAGRDAALLEEDVTPMFLAPPAVCVESGRTLLYGVVSTASAERSAAPADAATAFAGFDADTPAFIDHLVQPLRGESTAFPVPPLANRRFDAGWLEALLDAPTTSAEHRFLQLLRQVTSEFDAFGESAASEAVRTRLHAIRLDYALLGGETVRRQVPADEFLRDSARVLFDDGAGRVEMPERWPALSPGDRSALRRAMVRAVRERFAAVAGAEGRYDDPDATYRLRGFVRLRGDCGCPPRTIWTGYTEPFVIAPWYETSAQPIRISLPDLSDRALLRSLKPNVSFVVPPKLQGMLTASPGDLMKGKGGAASAVGWICSFSIPVITFCAFIVLNIFLSLFDLIFRWLMFIKVCIPYPKAK